MASLDKIKPSPPSPRASTGPAPSIFSGVFNGIAGMVSSVFRSSNSSRKVTVKPCGSNSLLSRIHTVTFAALAPRDYSQRKHTRQQIASEILPRGIPWKDSLNWRQFSTLLCPGIIRSTSMEGSFATTCAQACQQFIQACIEQNGIFFELNINKEVFQHLREALTTYLHFFSLQPPSSNTPASQKVIETAAQYYLETIRKVLSPDQCVYMPLGYRGGSASEGHALTCKIEDEPDHVVISLFNLGNGSQDHPILDYTLNQKKVSYTFFPIRIQKKYFYGEFGFTAFCQMIRYATDAPILGCSYDGNDLYDIWMQFVASKAGELILNLGKYGDEFACSQQFSGTCGQVAIDCLVKDVLIFRGVPRSERDKFSLNYHFFTLLAGYQAFCTPGRPPQARVLLHDAAQSFGAMVLDFHKKKQLPEREFIGAQAVVHEIVKATRTPSELVDEVEPSFIVLDPGLPFEFPLIPQLQDLSSSPGASVEAGGIHVEHIALAPPRFDPNSMAAILPTLEKWVSIVSDLPRKYAFGFVFDCFEVLPIPVYTEHDAWSQVPVRDVERILECFSRLLSIGLNGVDIASKFSDPAFMKENFAEQFLLIYTVCAITDRLARRCNNISRLEGFACPFLPHPFKITPYGFTSLPLAADNIRYTQLHDYFHGHLKEGMVIFPIRPVLDVPVFFQEYRSGEFSLQNFQGRNHVQYLCRVMHQNAAALPKDFATFLSHNWMASLPKIVQYLYRFLFIRDMLFYKPGEKFPSLYELEFIPISIGNQTGLKINTLFEERNKDPLSSSPLREFFPGNLALNIQDPIPEIRFEHFGIRLVKEDHNSIPFIPFHSPSVRALTTNDILCYILSEEDRAKWNISEVDLKTILNILHEPTLSCWKALQAFSLPQNYPILNHPGVQQALDACFFQPIFLTKQLEQEAPPLIQAFRKFIEEGLRYFNQNIYQLSAILFLIRSGIYFETFIPLDPHREEVLLSYHQLLQYLLDRPSLRPEDKDYIHTHLMLLETYRNEADPRFLFRLFFQARLEGIRTPPTASGLTSCFSKLLRRSGYKHAELLSDQESRNRICYGIVDKLLDDCPFSQELPEDGWVGSFPTYSCGTIILDFICGTISHKTHGVLEKIYALKGFDYLEGNLIRKHGSYFWVKRDGTKISLNGLLRYCPDKEQWIEVFHSSGKVSAEGIALEFYATEMEPFHQRFLSYKQMTHRKTSNGMITTHLRTTNQPYFRIERQGSKLVYTRLDKNGEPLPYKLVNVSDLGPHHPLCPYVRFVSAEEVLCFVKEDDLISPQAAELNFYSLGLEFIHDGKGLSSAQYSGFYLITRLQDLAFQDPSLFACMQKDSEILQKEAEDDHPDPAALHWARLKPQYDQIQAEINYLPFAFILYNPSSKKWIVLLPHGKIEQNRGDFSTEIQLVSWTIKEYFPYEFCLEDRRLKALRDNPNISYAYLALLFKMKRDYIRAYEYLKYLKPSPDLLEKISPAVDEFTHHNDFSPLSIRLNLELFLVLIRSAHLMFESLFKKRAENSPLMHFIHILWGIQNYHAYLNSSADVEVERVPGLMPLTIGQRKILLDFFRSGYQLYFRYEPSGWEVRWRKEQPLLNAQYNVFFLQGRQNTLTVTPQEVCLRPPVFDFVDLPSSIPVVVDGEEIVDHCIKTSRLTNSSLADLPAYPIQISKSDLLSHFPCLYERARQCKAGIIDPFDFILHTILKADFIEKMRYRSLLFWVRHFPDRFSSPEFSLQGISAEQSSPVLRKIMNQIRGLDSDPRFPEFVKTYLKPTATFDPHRQILLSVPLPQHQRIPAELAPPIPPAPLDFERHCQEMEDRIRTILNTPYKDKTNGAGLSDEDEARDESIFILKEDTSQMLTISRKAARKNEDLPVGIDIMSYIPEKLLKKAILTGDWTFILKEWPMLSREQVRTLCSSVREWYHTQVVLRLQKEGRSDCYVAYDYQKYPEISYFFLRTGKFPREKQLETYKWVCAGLERNQNRYFQQAAGDGKTDVLTPMLCLAAKRYGLMPVVCVTQSIYPIEKETLRFNLGALGEELGLLEVGMHSINTLTAADLKFIFLQLKQFKSEGKSLLVTPGTLNAFFLIRDLACFHSARPSDTDINTCGPQGKSRAIKLKVDESGDLSLIFRDLIHAFIMADAGLDEDAPGAVERGEKIRWATLILDFFKSSCVLICDEAHQNANPLNRAVYGVGQFRLMEKEESSHLLQLMKPLLGVYPEHRVCLANGTPVLDLVHLTEDGRALPSDEEFLNIQVALAHAYAKSFIPDMDQQMRDDFIAYWTKETAPCPEIVQKWASSSYPEDINRANLASLTGHFLLSILPETLKRQSGVDHRLSPYSPQRMHDSPAQNGLPSTAEHDDFHLTAALTIKRRFGQGLSLEDVRFMCKEMIAENLEEQRKGCLKDQTLSNQRFQSWIHQLPLQHALCGAQLENLVPSDDAMMVSLWKVLYKNKEVIEYFLIKYGCATVGSPLAQFTCTTTDLFHGFHNCILFSATPLHELVNPSCIGQDDYSIDPAIETAVRQQMRKPQNSTKIFVSSPAHFFKEMTQLYSDVFLQATVLIDPRGFFSDWKNHDLAKEWMEHNPQLDGVLYWKEARQSVHVDRDETICLLLKDGKTLQMEGNKIKATLKLHGIDLDSLNLGTIYDPSHAESAHIVQKPEALALFFPWKELTTRRTIQAIMRMRGFMQKQRVVWVFLEALARKIFPSPDAPIDVFLDWCDRNETEYLHKCIVINACQEIRYAIAQRAREEIQKALHGDSSPEMTEVIKVFEKRIKGLIEPLPRTTYEAFGHHETLQDTAIVLERFARSLYARFRYDTSFEQDPFVQNRVGKIITSVQTQIAQIHGHSFHSGSQQVEHHTELRTKTQREQQNQCPRHIESLALGNRIGDIRIYDPPFLDMPKQRVNLYFDTSLLTDNLFFSYEHTHTKKLINSTESQILKPIFFYTIVISKKRGANTPQIEAWTISDEINATDREDMIRCPAHVPELCHTVFLVTATGQLVQAGRGALTPPPELVSDILQSPWMRDLVVDAALLQGRIIDEEALLRRIKDSGWKEFEVLWEKILKTLPNRETAHDQAFKSLREKFEHREKLLSDS